MNNEDSCTEMISVTKVSQTIVPRDKGVLECWLKKVLILGTYQDDGDVNRIQHQAKGQ